MSKWTGVIKSTLVFVIGVTIFVTTLLYTDTYAKIPFIGQMHYFGYPIGFVAAGIGAISIWSEWPKMHSKPSIE